MALRVKVELVPYGIESEAEVLDEVLIGNNGTGVPGGRDSGGVGNYDVYDNMTLAEIRAMDYPREAKVGEIRGIERTPDHRLKVARLALEVVEQSRTPDEAAEEIQPVDESAPDPEFDREEEQDARR